MVSWLSVLAAAVIPVLRLSYSKLEHRLQVAPYGHAFLELCCASDSELAAAVVEHSVAIRVTSSEDLQLTSTRRALHRLLMICKAYEVVADIWVSIPCIAGTPFRRINEKLGAETGDLVMTYKLGVGAVGLRRRAVRIGDGFSWKWSNGNEPWKLGGCEEFLHEVWQFLLFGLDRSLWDDNLSIARGRALRQESGKS